MLAGVGVRFLLTLDPTGIPRAAEVGIDARMLGVRRCSSRWYRRCSSGLVPAMRGASPALQGTLRDTTLTASAGVGRQLIRRSLVTIEVALCVVLVLGAALMLRSFARLLSVDPGIPAVERAHGRRLVTADDLRRIRPASKCSIPA